MVGDSYVGWARCGSAASPYPWREAWLRTHERRRIAWNTDREVGVPSKEVTQQHEYENVPAEIATASLEDLSPAPGVAEAVELYEAAMRYYTVAASHVTQPARVSSTSSLQAASFGR